MFESLEWVEREELSVVCIKVVVKGNGRDQSTERGSVHTHTNIPWTGAIANCDFCFRHE